MLPEDKGKAALLRGQQSGPNEHSSQGDCIADQLFCAPVAVSASRIVLSSLSACLTIAAPIVLAVL